MHSVLYTECHAMGVGCGVGGHALKGVGWCDDDDDDLGTRRFGQSE